MKISVDSINAWYKKPVNMRLFFALVTIGIISMFIKPVLAAAFDTDMYFLIATGREIVSNGIPHVNVWTVNMSEGFVAQQWLYAVIVYAVDKIGYIGRFLFIVSELLALYFLFCHFFKLKGIDRKLTTVSFVIMILFSQPYMLNIRPELITIILLLIECIALEHYMLSHKAIWLSLLPLSMLLEMNLHASMWPVHYAILLAYFVPAFYVGCKSNGLYKNWKPMLLSILAMTGIMFVNPYGVDGVLYIIKSMKADPFSLMHVTECVPAYIFSEVGACVILNISILAVLLFKKLQNSTAVNITLGFSFLMAYTVRNVMFEPIVLMFMFANLMEYVSTIKIDWRKDAVNGIVPLFIAVDLYFASYGISSLITLSDVQSGSDITDGLMAIADYIDDDIESDDHIFTGFNAGAYLEYHGLKNVYIDARPELYMTEFIGKDNVDILMEYVTYCVSGQNSFRKTIGQGMPISADLMEAWLDKYDFRYMVVDHNTEVYLSAYLSQSDRYEEVDDLTTTAYMLYQRVDD